MEIEVLTQMISSIGFPIAMCIYMMYSNNKTIKELTTTIADNTNVMHKILEHFRVGDSE